MRTYILAILNVSKQFHLHNFWRNCATYMSSRKAARLCCEVRGMVHHSTPYGWPGAWFYSYLIIL